MTSLQTRFFADPAFNLTNFFDDFFCDFNTNYVAKEYDGFPVTNVYVNEKHDWKIEMALSGWRKEDIMVDVEDGTLKIIGDTSPKLDSNWVEVPVWKLIHGRIKKTNFERRFRISNKLDVEKAEVSFKNGILTIVIPSKDDAKPKRLEIK